MERTTGEEADALDEVDRGTMLERAAHILEWNNRIKIILDCCVIIISK